MVERDDKLRKAAMSFLKSGRVGRTDSLQLTEACNRLVRDTTQKSIKRAITLGRSFVDHARNCSGISTVVALRAYGWALHMGGKYADAKQAYLSARNIARHDPVARARIDRILIDIYMYLGDFKEARRRARQSIAGFEKLGFEEDVAKTRINYANLYHRQDRHQEANEQYTKAAEYLEMHGGDLVLGLCYYNQANTLVQLFDFKKAWALYEKASTRFAKHGFDLYVNECKYGMAWLDMLQGNYHLALVALAECEQAYQKASQPKGAMLCELDRAEAFLGLNLFPDARVAAMTAEKAARALGIHYESAKAAFFVARAATVLEKHTEAQAAIERARFGFRKENNHGFEAAVKLFAAMVKGHGKVATKTLSEVRKQFSRSQLPLWEAICDLELLSLRQDSKPIWTRLEKNPAVRSVPHLYAQWQTRLGDHDAAHGRAEDAAAHWAQAVEVLDAVRAKLPPVEMRSSFMQQRGDPYLRLVEKDSHGRPEQAAIWAERHRTAGVWAPVDDRAVGLETRNAVERSLQELAGRVTAISAQISRTGGKRSSAAHSKLAQLSKLQSEVRDSLARMEQRGYYQGAHTRQILEAIREVSRLRPIIQFQFVQRDLMVFVHVDGETRSHRYVDGLRIAEEFMGCWNILLGRSLISGTKKTTADLKEEQTLFAEIGSWLWSPLEIPRDRKQLLILPDGRISNLPWMAVIHEGEPLVARHELILSPSIRHHFRAVKTKVKSEKIDVFVGEVTGLPHTRRELDLLSEDVQRSISVYEPCRREDWSRNGDAWIWHYTGHADFRSDNPFYSSLMLADGPLFAADFRLKRNAVGVVTLAACRTAGQSVMPGEESTGLVRSLLEMGAKSVVASHWSVADKSTSVWMRHFYESLFDNHSVGESVRLAALRTHERYPYAYDWAAFSVFGSG